VRSLLRPHDARERLLLGERSIEDSVSIHRTVTYGNRAHNSPLPVLMNRYPRHCNILTKNAFSEY